MIHAKLTKQEYTALFHLSNGSNYTAAYRAMGISRTHFHVVCQHIREKTGLYSTQDAAACRKVFRALAEQRNLSSRWDKEPTARQLEAMRLRAAGYSYNQISAAMNISPQTAQNQVSIGSKRAGLPQNMQRRAAIREYLAEREEKSTQIPPTMEDPAFN